jgi:hypothetical protein
MRRHWVQKHPAQYAPDISKKERFNCFQNSG